ncbi:MAG: thermonuclease family protein [Verrucomicrobiota bacterium]
MKRRILFFAIFVILCGESHPILADSFTGIVDRVIDGDTVVVERACPLACGSLQRVRLAEIDAPELAQDYGEESKRALAELVLNKQVRIEYSEKDFFGRIVGRVYITRADSIEADVNAAMIAGGHAWWYKKYSDSKTLRELQETAKAGKVGLWEGQAVAPWGFRRKRGRGR